MSTEQNAYYSPEANGWTTIGEVSWSKPCYDFDLTGVWSDAEGNLLWADDSGCSCPSPFDGHDESDFERGSKYTLLTHLTKRLTELFESGYTQGEKDYAANQVATIVEKVFLGEFK
jgi:hypothetical protein